MTAGQSAQTPIAIAPARPGPDRPVGRRAVLGLPLRLTALVGLSSTGVSLLTGCSPQLDWRESRLPGGEVLVQLPGRPASMTRQIHLRSEEIRMTMVGAEVEGQAFTVAIAGGEEGISDDDIARRLDDMREQMLRNIATSFDSATESRQLPLPVLDGAGARRGTREAAFLDARGAPPHERIRMQAAFFTARRAAAQAVVIGQRFDELAARHFFASLRIVES